MKKSKIVCFYYYTDNAYTESRSGRRHHYFQLLSLLQKALTTLLSGWRKLSRPLAKTVR